MAAPPISHMQRTKMIVKSSSNIKEIPETELAKHKVRDIIGFIKAGNLSMVHGLI